MNTAQYDTEEWGAAPSKSKPKHKNKHRSKQRDSKRQYEESEECQIQ